MGLSVSKLFARLFSKKEMRILMVGLVSEKLQGPAGSSEQVSELTLALALQDAAGKTTILYKVSENGWQAASCMPRHALR